MTTPKPTYSDAALLLTDKKELLKSGDTVIDQLVDDLQKAGLEISRLRDLLDANGIKHD